MILMLKDSGNAVESHWFSPGTPVFSHRDCQPFLSHMVAVK